MAGGVLAVFAHPDDESLLAGGVLAGCAAAGLRVAIVSMTRGERGPTEASGGHRPLGEIRPAELRAAARALGASAAECLDYPDGELPDVDEREASRAIASVLERERPQAVLTFSEEGLYWHPDHLAVSRLVDAGLEVLGRDAPEWLYGATWPEGHAARLASLMRDRGLVDDLWGLEPEAFGAPAESITLSLDVRPFLQAKLAALRSYASQIGPSHLLSALPNELAEEFLGREYFMRLRPEQARQDWLTETLART
jgi:N-acetyl-1-D-myo-inositol-2-amino-2-deoxy-alpha-D-glucopyranoside deacetylase